MVHIRLQYIVWGFSIYSENRKSDHNEQITSINQTMNCLTFGFTSLHATMITHSYLIWVWGSDALLLQFTNDNGNVMHLLIFILLINLWWSIWKLNIWMARSTGTLTLSSKLDLYCKDSAEDSRSRRMVGTWEKKKWRMKPWLKSFVLLAFDQ